MKKLFLTSLTIVLLTGLLCAQRYSKDVALEVGVTTTSSSINLSWPYDQDVGGYLIYRKALGSTGWGGHISQQSGLGINYRDNQVTTDSLYEYKVVSWDTTTSDTAYAYVTAGIEVEPEHFLGTMLLLVEQTYYGQYISDVERLERDLIGSGYHVVTKLVHRNMPVDSVTSIIRNEYMNRGAQLTSLFLLGRVPVPYSGDLVPDGHTNNHRGAWPADGFYGEVNSLIDPVRTTPNPNIWTDSRWSSSGSAPTRMRNSRGDGKYDNSFFPSTVDLEVGRVDFYDIPSFTATEAQLIKQYLQKNHDYRHGNWRVQKRALIDDNFGYFSGEAFASNAYRSFPSMVGSQNVDTGNFRSVLSQNDYLFSYGCGAGTYTSANGILTTSQLVNDSLQSVFSFLFGSYFGDYDSQNNLMRAHLAKGNVLATAWAGRPKWLIHPMAMGKSIGYCARLTQNATDYDMNHAYNPSTTDNHARSVHIALMGDPSLTMDITEPASGLQATLVGTNDVQLNWTAPSGQVAGYYLYKKPDTSNTYSLVSDQMITSTSYLDECLLLQGDYHYMLRSVELINGNSGSYYNLSQGIFDTVNNPNSVIVIPDFSLIASNDTVFIQNQSTATNMQWDFDNGTTSTSLNPQFSTYNQNGTYYISQVVSKGCYSDTLVKAIDVTGIYKLPPSNLVITETPGGHAKLVWNAAPDLTEGYTVDRYIKGSSFSERFSQIYDTTYTDSCLDFNDKYEYQVSSFRRDTFANGWRTNYTPPIPGNRFIADSFALSQDYTLKADFALTQTGLDVTLTDKAVSADSYWWDMGDGTKYFSSNAPLHSYSVEDTYTIQQAVERYCPQGIPVKRVDTARKTIEVKKETISVGELINASALMIAPNPFNDDFTITLEKDHSINYYMIFDNNGKELINSKVTPDSGEIRIEMGQFESGIYILHLQNDSGPPLVRQVIKQ